MKRAIVANLQDWTAIDGLNPFLIVRHFELPHTEIIEIVNQVPAFEDPPPELMMK